MNNNCKHYDAELDCCKYFSDWTEAMPVLQPCTESPCDKYCSTEKGSKKMIDVLDRVEGKLVYAADVLDLFYVASAGQDKAFIAVVEDVIENVPAVDVEEIKYGEWQIKSEIYQTFDDVDEELYVECPFCKRRFYVPFEFDDEKTFEYAEKNYPYCNCGAKMSGGTN